MRLKSRIMAILTIFMVLQLVAISLPSNFIYQKFFQQQVREHIDDSLFQTEKAFITHLKRMESDSQLFSQSHTLERYLKIQDESLRFNLMHKAVLNEFSSYRSANPDYFEISLILLDGFEEVAQMAPESINLTDEEMETYYFQAIANSEHDYLSMIGINPDDGRWALIASRKLFIQSNADSSRNPKQLAGYLVVKSDVAFLEELFSKNSLGQKGHVVLYTENGQIILGKDGENAIAKAHLKHLRSIENDSHAYSILNAKTEHQPNNLPLPEEINPPVNNSTLIVGQKRLANGLSLDIAWPQSELGVMVKQLSQTTLQISMLLLALILIVLFMVLNKILIRPIRRLGEAATAMGKGSEKWTFTSKNTDELSELADTIKKMGFRLIEQQRKLHDIAYVDSLTNLPNRRRFLDDLDYHFSLEETELAQTALLFIDLDGFKHVNDRCGHQAGDWLLKAVAVRLKNALRADDQVSIPSHFRKTDRSDIARLGGDEFTVLLRHIPNRSAIEQVAQRILDCLQQPFTIENKEFFIGASIGIAIGSQDGESAVDLLKNADAAMYSAKNKGKNTYQFFSYSEAQQSLKSLEIKTDLQKAIKNDDLMLVYQPQICATRGVMVGMEALVRWKMPDKGWIRPDVFIPIAEESGLIIPLGRWVLLEACRQIRLWQDEGLLVVPVSVNLSNVQLAREDMFQTVQDCLKATGLSSELLKLEVTESSIMQGQDSIDQLDRIGSLGIPIALDDFGTGYSSLSALRGLPIDELKIDKSFISDINPGEEGQAIVSAIIAMGHQLNLAIVAEGVETEEELNFLKQKKTDVIQGYFFSKPLTPKDMQQAYLVRGSEIDQGKRQDLQCAV
jgi:diguanylate cyclase (GGDEF)-like protein